MFSISLTCATILTGLILLGKGAWFLSSNAKTQALTKASLRNKPVTGVLLVLATAWFIYHLVHLGPSDFGDYKHYMILFVTGVAVGSWFYVPDFLAVRAACGLNLLYAQLMLKSAFAHYELPQRLFLVSIIYIGICGALYFGALPYRMRDLLNWLYDKPLRSRLLGCFMALYGLILLGTSFTY